MLESIIKTSTMNSVNAQLKGVNIILNTLNENVIKTKEKVKNLLNEKDENNYIISEIIIKESDLNKDIRILNSYEKCLRTEPNKNWIKDEY